MVNVTSGVNNWGPLIVGFATQLLSKEHWEHTASQSSGACARVLVEDVSLGDVSMGTCKGNPALRPTL